MAENGTSMKATHVCMKTYFLKNRSGEVVSLTVPALYVKTVNQDLLSRKACNKIGVSIILAIPYSKGLKKLAGYKFDEHEMCLACMIGESKMQNVLRPGKRATRPLGKVNFNLIVSSIPSIEEYYYGALFVDDHTGYKWLYGFKTKDEALNAATRWMAEIADLREKYPL